MAEADSLGVTEALESLGISGADGLQRARAVLDAARVTNPRRDRLSRAKLPRVREVLAEAYHLACPSPACVAAGGGRPVLHVRREFCPVCGGSNTRRAAGDLLEACARAGIRRVCIVGGSPAVREELRATVGESLHLTLVDGTLTPDRNVSRAHVRSHDVVLLCGSSELDHKTSNTYSAWKAEGHVIAVARRGAEAILEALATHARNRVAQR